MGGRQRGYNGTESTRFWSKVDKTGSCWLWTSSKIALGYGHYWDSDLRKQVLAHRRAFELCRGPIPPGLTLDHLCRTPSCVNPEHLEPVTMRENLRRSDAASAVNARKTHCIASHSLLGDNLYVTPDGRRQCRECTAERSRKYEAKRARRNRRVEVAA